MLIAWLDRDRVDLPEFIGLELDGRVRDPRRLL